MLLRDEELALVTVEASRPRHRAFVSEEVFVGNITPC